MSEELTAKKTPVTSQEMFDVMMAVWPSVLHEEPSKPVLLLLLAQWALETAYGKCMWCYNIGNVKAKPGGAYDYCYFPAGEIVSTASAEKELEKHPDTVTIKTRFKNGTSEVYFRPKHPTSCFRAFHTIEEAMADYLSLMRKRFDKAWSRVLSTDPVGFCHALKLQGYYTASEALYTRNVVSIYSNFLRTLGAVEVPVSVAAPVASSFPLSPVEDAYEDDGSPISSVYSFEMTCLSSTLEG
jgi:hypothetical protein